MSLIEEITFAVTDVETTGSSASKNRIMEIGCVKVLNGKIVSENHALINPEQFIPPYVQEMTGITNAIAINAPRASETLPIIREWYPREAVFTAHNLAFDFNFVQAEFQRHNILPLHAPNLCTLRLAKRILSKRKRNGLSSLASYFGIRLKNHHSAIDDARATAYILIELLEILQNEHDCEYLEDVLRFQHKNLTKLKTLPKHISKISNSINTLPNSSGVYKILNSKKEVLYVGKAKNLKNRLADYFSISSTLAKKISKMVSLARDVKIIETASEIEALILESKLIKELKPEYNTFQKRYKGSAFLKIDYNEKFPMITIEREIVNQDSEYYGPFPNLDSALFIQQIIDKSFKLRKCVNMPSPSDEVIPCIYYQIDKCDAPCALLQSEIEYKNELHKVKEFLSGNDGGVIDLLKYQMKTASDNLDFETAANIRNMIQNLNKAFQNTSELTGSINNKNGIFISTLDEDILEAIFIVRGRVGHVLRFEINSFDSYGLNEIIQEIYFSKEKIVKNLSKPEIDEMRVISSYIYRKRHEGELIPINESSKVDLLLNEIKSKSILRINNLKDDTIKLKKED